MAWYNEQNPDTLNFIVTGNCWSGCELLQQALMYHPSIACHGDVLHEEEAIRKAAHESYFGDSGRLPDWYLPGYLSVEQYLDNKIFDNPLHNEKAIGVSVDYELFARNGLWEYLDQKYRHGDFCLLHVTRNPVACFVAKQQAEGNTGIVGLQKLKQPSSTITLDPTELVTFVREHLAAELKINRLCPDRVVIPYHELILDLHRVTKQLYKFLDVPSHDVKGLVQPTHIGNVRRNIINWIQLQTALPLDVHAQLVSNTLL